MLKEAFKRYYFLIPAIVFAILYFQSIFYGYAWGDDPMVISAPARDFKLMLQTFYDSSIYSGGVHYYPLLFFQCFLINKIFGESAYPMYFHIYHYFAVILICILASILFYKITKNKLVSVLIVLIWAIHPVNVQNFTRLLMASGYMVIALSFGFLVLYVRLPEIISPGLRKIILFLANFLFFLTLLQAESSILFLPILFLIFYLQEGKNIFRKRNFCLLYPLVFVIPLYLLLRFNASGGMFHSSVDSELMKWTEFGSFKDVLFRAFWLAPQLVVHYFKLIFYPFGLVDSKAEWYKVGSSLFSAYSIFCQLAVAMLIFLAIYLHKRLPLFSLGIFWFFVSIALYIQIFPLFTIAGIRYICVPMLGVLLAIFSLLTSKKKFFSNKALLILFTPIIVFLGLRTIYYLPSSKDFLYQYIYCAKEAPLWNKPNCLAKAIDTAWDEKREDELPDWLTEKAFEKAVYDWLDKYSNLKRDLSIEYGPMQMAYNFYVFRGVFKFLFIDGQMEKLNKVMNTALEVNDKWMGWHEIARFFHQTEQYKTAWKALKNAIQQNPKFKSSYGFRFIEIAIKAGAADEANEILDKYILLSPTSSYPYFVKGLFMNELGNIKEATRYFLKASDPDKSLSVGEDGMYYFAGNFFMKYGMYKEAKRVLGLALKFDPFNEKIRDKINEIEKQRGAVSSY